MIKIDKQLDLVTFSDDRGNELRCDFTNNKAIYNLNNTNQHEWYTILGVPYRATASPLNTTDVPPLWAYDFMRKHVPLAHPALRAILNGTIPDPVFSTARRMTFQFSLKEHSGILQESSLSEDVIDKFMADMAAFKNALSIPIQRDVALCPFMGYDRLPHYREMTKLWEKMRPLDRLALLIHAGMFPRYTDTLAAAR